ncbi:hypothetical protein K438DRAFT_1771378 [Mycena galopus ATCC 62051]|nr:hypothetical protein K438DRAFT_1771378 [Mycena galopus ATCC 62051]
MGCGETEKPRREKGSPVTTVVRVLDSMRLCSLPWILLNVGQMLIVAGYAVFALLCIFLQVPLIENPNRAGFLALAQLPPAFLFASRNSPLTALLLGPGVDYTKLNYIHRWSAPFLFLGAMIRGSLWINNRVVFGLPILTRQKEASGIAALGTLCLFVLTSVAPVRRWCYAAFLVLHYLLLPTLIVTVWYHTIYATPWIFPPLAFYGTDLLLRVVRWRFVVGRVKGNEGGMSLIYIPRASTGWRAGQHVQLRALTEGEGWEAHPLSVCNAPSGEGCLRMCADAGRWGGITGGGGGGSARVHRTRLSGGRSLGFSKGNLQEIPPRVHGVLDEEDRPVHRHIRKTVAEPYTRLVLVYLGLPLCAYYAPLGAPWATQHIYLLSYLRATSILKSDARVLVNHDMVTNNVVTTSLSLSSPISLSQSACPFVFLHFYFGSCFSCATSAAPSLPDLLNATGMPQGFKSLKNPSSSRLFFKTIILKFLDMSRARWRRESRVRHVTRICEKEYRGIRVGTVPEPVSAYASTRKRYQVGVGFPDAASESILITSPRPRIPKTTSIWRQERARAKGGAREGVAHENREPAFEEQTEDEDADLPGRKILLILEGPYGGPTLRASEYERVLLFAGGSGVTFTLGVLDELVGRAVRLAPNLQHGIVKTRRVVWCWCVRSFGAILWFAPYLLQIATLAALPSSHIDLRIRIFVTCLCDPSAVPEIPGCTLTEGRPSMGRVLERLLDDVLAPGADCCGKLDAIRGKREAGSEASNAFSSMDDLLADLEKGGAGGEESEVEPSGSGGVAVFAAGPRSLIREAGNAVANANLMGERGRRAGGVAFNAEVYTI